MNMHRIATLVPFSQIPVGGYFGLFTNRYLFIFRKTKGVISHTRADLYDIHDPIITVASPILEAIGMIAEPILGDQLVYKMENCEYAVESTIRHNDDPSIIPIITAQEYPDICSIAVDSETQYFAFQNKNYGILLTDISSGQSGTLNPEQKLLYYPTWRLKIQAGDRLVTVASIMPHDLKKLENGDKDGLAYKYHPMLETDGGYLHILDDGFYLADKPVPAELVKEAVERTKREGHSLPSTIEITPADSLVTVH